MTAPSVEAYPFVALRDLSLHGVLAFVRGDRIPADHPDAHGWELGVDYAEAGSEVAEEIVAGPQRPTKSASKEAWVDYVVALHEAGEPLGLPRDEAEARTRDDLIAHIDETA
ncbi:MAG TPA: hypothetical protein VJX66_32040 [Amycolatopsis sp.]|nr:hypothetical protein [Amycolatopsis sp.]